VHRVRCIPPVIAVVPPGTPVSPTIKIQTVFCPRGPLGSLAFMLKVSPSLNKVDYYYELYNVSKLGLSGS
jgi:hypothetical protein